MNTHERIQRVYEHRTPDRVPVTDWFWESTIVRWRAEGLPADADLGRYLGLDDIAVIGFDTSPRFETAVIEEGENYRIERDSWGITKKNFKPVSATFEHLDHRVKDRASWEAAKRRMTPTPDRISWEWLEACYRQWRANGAWIVAAPWYGYDVISARMCSTETILFAMAEDPEWVKDMCDTGCELSLALLDMMWEKGYPIDELMWYDDMAYRNGLMFSREMWREVIRPYQKRTIDWAHAHGVKAHLHCCGRINELIGDLADLGLDALNPLEVKAGVDPARVKRDFGGRLVLRGGFDIQNWSDLPAAERDIRDLLPVMMKDGGYIFASDHSVADNVSLADYQRIIALAKDVGRYD